MSHSPRHQQTDNTTGDLTNVPTSNITSSSLRAEDLVAMAEEHDLRQIYASCGLTYPPTNCKPATAPKPEDGQTLDDIYADLDDGRGIVFIDPPMTYEAALAHHRDEVEKARSEGRPDPAPPTVRPPRHGPEWVKGMLAMVISSGYKVAPPDYPVLAAYTTIPSIGLALIPGDD